MRLHLSAIGTASALHEGRVALRHNDQAAIQTALHRRVSTWTKSPMPIGDGKARQPA